MEAPRELQEFKVELTENLRKHGIGAYFGMPDAILAMFLLDQLATLNTLQLDLEEHFAAKDKGFLPPPPTKAN